MKNIISLEIYQQILKSLRQDIVMMNLETECRKQLRSFLSDENEHYNQQGLNWVIGKDFFWLELYVMLGK